MSLGLALVRDLAAKHRATRCLATITCDLCLIIEVLGKLDTTQEALRVVDSHRPRGMGAPDEVTIDAFDPMWKSVSGALEALK